MPRKLSAAAIRMFWPKRSVRNAKMVAMQFGARWRRISRRLETPTARPDERLAHHRDPGTACDPRHDLQQAEAEKQHA
jgi:hypothetical protein